jgi:hypothetical protein
MNEIQFVAFPEKLANDPELFELGINQLELEFAHLQKALAVAEAARQAILERSAGVGNDELLIKGLNAYCRLLDVQSACDRLEPVVAALRDALDANAIADEFAIKLLTVNVGQASRLLRRGRRFAQEHESGTRSVALYMFGNEARKLYEQERPGPNHAQP